VAPHSNIKSRRIQFYCLTSFFIGFYYFPSNQLRSIESSRQTYNMRFFNHISQAYPPKPSFTEKDLPDLHGKVSALRTQPHVSLVSIDSEIGLHCHWFKYRSRQRAGTNPILKARQSLCRLSLTGKKSKGHRGNQRSCTGFNWRVDILGTGSG
jgi:hypothetical protein